MIVNELVSVLRYQVQEGALNRFRRGLQGAADLARRTGRGLRDFGVGFAQGARSAIQQQVALRRAIRETAAEAQKASQEVSGVASQVRNYVTAALGGIGIRGAANIADDWSGIRARVGLEVDEAQVDDTLKQLYAMAQNAGTSYSDTSSVYLPFVRNRKEIGVTNDDVLKLTDNIGKLMTIGGGSASSQAAALTQFGQAMGAGKLSGEELNSVLEQAPRLAKAIADSFGVPVGKLKEMAGEGKLTAKELAKGLLSQSESINAEFAKMPMTFGRSMTYLMNGVGRFIDRWARLTNAAGFFNKAIRLIVDNIDHLAGMGAIAALMFAMTQLRRLTLAALLPLVRMVAVLAGLYLAAQDVMVWAQGGDSFLGTFIGDVSEWQGAIDAVKDGFRWFKNAIGDNSSSLGDFAKKWGALALVVYALSKPIVYIALLLGKTVGLVLKIGAAFLIVMKYAFLALRVLLAFASWPALIAAAIIGAAILIWQNFERIRQFLIGMWNEVAGAVRTAFGAVGSYFTALWAQAGAEFRAVFAAIATYFTALWAQALRETQSIFSNIGAFFKDAMTSAVDFVAGYIPRKIGEAFNAAKGFLSGLLPGGMNLSATNAAAAGSVATAPANVSAIASGGNVSMQNNFNISARSEAPRDIANAARGAVEGPLRRAGVQAARGMPTVEAMP